VPKDTTDSSECGPFDQAMQWAPQLSLERSTLKSKNVHLMIEAWKEHGTYKMGENFNIGKPC